MRRFFSRLAWNNLSIRVKTGLMFLLHMFLISLMALAAFLSLRNVGQRVEGAITTAVEMRSLSQDMQLDTQRLQSLVSTVQSGFETQFYTRMSANWQSSYTELAQRILDNAARLEDLSDQAVNPSDRMGMLAEIRAIEANVTATEQSFTAMLDAVAQLSTPREGAIPLLNAYGVALEEVTIEQGNNDLLSRFLLMRSLEETLIEAGDQAALSSFQEAANAYREVYDRIPLTERQAGIPTALDNYVAQAKEVVRLIGLLRSNHDASQLYLGYVRDAASRLGTITNAQSTSQLAAVRQIQGATVFTLLAGLIITLVVGGTSSYLFGRAIFNSLSNLLYAAQSLEKGNLDARAEVNGEDEFNRLATAFNTMAIQLQGLIGGLEQRVAERARDLSITAEIGRAVVEFTEPRELMNNVIELVRQRFGFYHAQVFLIDDAGERANLVASTGAAGRALLARRHYLEVGSRSVIGQVTATGMPVIASDTDVSAIHKRNELLPDTRSEMALPMRIGDKVIGALDIQSVAPNAFDESSVAVFQTVADQLAIALESARLHAQLSDALAQLREIERRATLEAWQSFRQSRSPNAPLGYHLREGDVIPQPPEAMPSPLSEAIRTGRVVSWRDGGEEINLAVPIKVRGETVGAFGFGGEALYDLSEEDIALLEAVADRVGLAIENLRLVEQTARRAEHEQIVNEITAKIVGSTDVNQILQTTVRELGRVLRAPQTSVQLRKEYEQK
jgi:GAF domain-containing protein/HAMP domain-containing protein